MKKLLILLITMNLLSPSAFCYVYSDYDWIEYNGHQYALTLEYSDWSQSEAWANEIGFHLVTINDESENTWLTETFYEDDPIWIGFYQDHDDPGFSEPGGGWKWTSGEPIAYTNWKPGLEPNNGPGGGDEDFACLYIDIPGVWNDWGPETPSYYPVNGIIETPEPATVLPIGLGGVFLRRRKA